MRTITKIFTFILFLGFNFTIHAQSWKKYDDFETGFINSNKWDVINVDNTGKVIGTVSVVNIGSNKKMRIVHYPVTPTSGNFIFIDLKQFKSSIQGIRANINVHSCTGNQEAGVETTIGYVDKTGSNFNVLYAQSSVRPYNNVIAGISFVTQFKPNGDYVDFVRDDSWNGIYPTDTITGKNKVVYVRVNKNNGKSMYWYVQNSGLSVRHLPAKVKALPLSLKTNSILTRRREDVGHSADNCVVDIDNVMVYR